MNTATIKQNEMNLDSMVSSVITRRDPVGI